MQCVPVWQSLQLYGLDGGHFLAAGAPHAGAGPLARPHPVQAEDVRPEVKSGSQVEFSLA